MNDKVAVFGQRRAGVYLLSEIYDPDNVNSSVQNVGKVIPAVGSLVIDDSIAEHNVLYVVYSVDPVTFKTTLVPASIVNITDLNDNQIITYGSNIYMVYYKQESMEIFELTEDTIFIANRTYYTRSGSSPDFVYTEAQVEPGEEVPPNTYYVKVDKTLWSLDIDNKISIFGNAAASYALFKGNTLIGQTSPVPVSNYYVNDNDEIIETIRVPMDTVIVPALNNVGEPITTQAKKPRKCYSATTIEDGSPYLLAVYSDTGMLIAQIVLVAHEVLGLSELASVQWPIEEFYITANQYDNEDHKAYLIRGQSLDELIFYPNIKYANGDVISRAAIDQTQLFMYGKEEISTAVPGSEFEVLFKYYLGPTEATDPNRDYYIGASERFIYTKIKVKIITSSFSTISKISPIVYFDPATGYNVLPLIYYLNGQESSVARNTDCIASAFDGTVYNVAQALKLRAYEQVGNEAPAPYYQTYQINLFDPLTNPVGYYYRNEPTTTGNYYGMDTAIKPRPVIYHNVDQDNYYISAGKFANPNMFLNSFYFTADPPIAENEVYLKTPTHFQIKKLDTAARTITTVTVNPIPVENYSNFIGVTEDISSETNYPATCVVEFLYRDRNMAAGEYQYLFGVPVSVVNV